MTKQKNNLTPSQRAILRRLDQGRIPMNASKEDEQAIDAYLNAQYESLQHGLRQWEAQMLGMDDVTFADYASKVVEAGNVVHINCMRRVQDMRKLASLTPIQHDGRGEA